jgi:hypothetical protein
VCYISFAMVQILHISDPHAQFKTMEHLHNLALAQAACDVVALTGDCTSTHCKALPQDWNFWPQALLLSVPGNHDKPETFANLPSWISNAPWVERFEDLVLLGLASLDPTPLRQALDAADCLAWEGCRAVVLLSHYRPKFDLHTGLEAILTAFVGERPFLVLHGDEHPRDFCGAEWDVSGRFGDGTYFRSNICSSTSRRRGIAHRIEWDGETFRCTEVQG